MRYHFEMLGRYNQWLNSKIYLAASRLSEKDLAENHGAFFGSILGTLNHIMVGDIIWLKRFAKYPSSMVSLSGVVIIGFGMSTFTVPIIRVVESVGVVDSNPNASSILTSSTREK